MTASDLPKTRRKLPFVWPKRYRLSRMQQASTLWAIGIAVKKHLPLPTALDAYAEDVPDVWRRKVLELSEELDRGVGLADALEAIPGIVPQESIAAIRMGSESGTLPDLLMDEARRLQSAPFDGRYSATASLGYLICLGTILFLIAFFLTMFIIPKYKHILHDFGMELPGTTRAFIFAADAFTAYAWLVVPLLVILGVTTVRYAYLIDRQFQTSGSWLPFLRSPPLLSRLILRTRMATVLKWLSGIVERGRPLEGCFGTLARYHPHHDLGDRLSRVYVEVQHGDDCWESLGSVKLLKPREVSVLTSAERAGNLAWALKQLAVRIDNEVRDRCRLMLSLLGPAILLVMAVVVAWILISFFTPVLVIINNLS